MRLLRPEQQQEEKSQNRPEAQEKATASQMQTSMLWPREAWMLYFFSAVLKVAVRVAKRIVAVSAKPIRKMLLMDETIVVTRLPQRLKRAKTPTTTSTAVEMTATK